MIDQILQSHLDFFRVYIDNIVIYTKSCTLQDYLEHLNKIFELLTEKGICLFSKKLFLDYLTVQLLDQCVNTLELTTAEDKLAVIVNIKFSHTLSALKKYLEMINYLHQYILYYTVIIRPLQERKTRLNYDLQKLWAEQRSSDEKNIEDNTCKLMVSRTAIEKFTLSELDSFHQLQGFFSRSIILIYYDLKHQLYADINTLKKFSFEAHIYHMKESHSSISGQKSIKLILFLNKTLANTKTQYWSTELEITDLI